MNANIDSNLQNVDKVFDLIEFHKNEKYIYNFYDNIF